ncbi:hypothetical protein ACO0OE_002152 [Hanseniaspora uvarum]
MLKFVNQSKVFVIKNNTSFQKNLFSTSSVILNKDTKVFKPSKEDIPVWEEQISEIHTKIEKLDSNNEDNLFFNEHDVLPLRGDTFIPNKEQIQDAVAVPKDVLVKKNLDFDLEQVINMTMRHGDKKKATETIMKALKLLQMKVYKDKIPRGNNSLEMYSHIVPEVPFEFKEEDNLNNVSDGEKIVNDMLVNDTMQYKQKFDNDIKFKETEYSLPSQVSMLKYCLTQLAPLCKIRNSIISGRKVTTPVVLNRRQRNYRAWKWIYDASWNRSAKDQSIKLYEELLKVYDGTSSLYAKKDQIHLECVQNRAQIKNVIRKQ